MTKFNIQIFKLWQTNKLFFIIGLLFFMTSLYAGKIFFRIGKYRNVEILRVTAKGIHISHSEGMRYITENDLSDGQKKLLSAEIEQYHKLKSSHIAHVKKLRKQQTEQLIEKNKDKLANLIRQEAERQEAERQEAERQEAERQAAERQAAERRAAERRAAERRAAERRAAERRAAERSDTSSRRCKTCMGIGVINNVVVNGRYRNWYGCPACNGRGKIGGRELIRTL